ncbi:hypothetical protein ERJ75_001743500 [Trypanosoma vivax]|uniref:Uncharacterized protein n=1 Tax=Trypanosoma vivax (strain Y486) TaxID=1055687 RepID=G0U2S9_TRYVY|nr:hypothetical protein ERJ75_001743500 [Trypanosoma vivax]CCC50583.1 conserved hypothetical protein [Trypanosoma vivax Y486]
MKIGRLYKSTKNALVSLCGFIAGFFAYRYVLEHNLISDTYLRHINLANLRLQLFLQQNVLPTVLVERYGYNEDFLRAMVERLSSEGSGTERCSFKQILQECHVPEQIAWLEEHVSSEIPYFYIADIFNGWCTLHNGFFMKNDSLPRSQNSANSVTHSDDDFASEILCSGVVEKAVSNVLPYDVAVRTLCILAVSNQVNARLISKLLSPKLILDRFEMYLKNLEEFGQSAGDGVPTNEVAVATVELLQAINTVLREQRGFLWSRVTSEAYPIATHLTADKWCGLVHNRLPTVEGSGRDSGVNFARRLSERFKCLEKEHGSKNAAAGPPGNTQAKEGFVS